MQATQHDRAAWHAVASSRVSQMLQKQALSHTGAWGAGGATCALTVCCAGFVLLLQDFRGFSRTGKPKVLVMSYPCFRGHKAEVYKLGIDVLMCDEVRGRSAPGPVAVGLGSCAQQDSRLEHAGSASSTGFRSRRVTDLVSVRRHFAGALPQEWRRTDHTSCGWPVNAATAAHVRSAGHSTCRTGSQALQHKATRG